MTKGETVYIAVVLINYQISDTMPIVIICSKYVSKYICMYLSYKLCKLTT